MNFEKPDYKITDYVESNNYGKFELEPLERGFGMTIGNALRRVMLSSMPGSAIVAVKIDGVQHEFQTMEGVIEDVTAIILNLKGIAIRNHSDEVKTARLSVHEERTVTAGDIVCDSDGKEVSCSGDKDSSSDSSNSNNSTSNINLVSMISPVSRGSDVTISIKGLPNTTYDIDVMYSSGESKAKGLEDKTSDSEGNVSWTFKVSSNVKPGTYEVKITDGENSASYNLEVTE